MRQIWALLTIILLIFSACEEENLTSPTFDTPQGSRVIEQWNTLIAKDSKNPNLYYQRALSYIEEKKYSRAISDLDTAIALNDSLPYLHVQKAEIFLNVRDPLSSLPDSKEAILTLEKYLEKYPDQLEVAAELARTYTIVLQFDKSNKVITSLLERDSKNPEWYFMLGNNLREMGDTTACLKAYQRAVEVDPEFTPAYEESGYLLAKQKNALALQLYTNALRINPQDQKVRFNLAVTQHAFGKYEDAISSYKEVIKNEVQNHAAHYNLGVVYYDIDSFALAIQSFTSAVRMAPEFRDAYYMRALAYEFNGEYDAAISDYRKTLALDPEYTIAIDECKIW